ncbi:hypothetical protein D0Y65_051422 [Glycine soja]|uniref:Uncharacterized protein n=1 Tax=Glycine soja TaxID=3848 RepID=A0A445FG61_GLYSO|nr:hypothetical protein D0Y65_051422 [Glycine soja]
MGRNSEMLYTNLLQNITQDLTPVKPCLVEGIPDMWIWNHSVSGVYTTKSAYAWLSNVQVGDGVLSRRALPERERNQCADSLAKLGVDQEDAFVVLPIPPSVLNLALMADMSCVLFPRL